MDEEDKTVAIMAEVLYLINLMLLPGLAFLLLFFLYIKYRQCDSAFTANHLSQTLGVSLLGGAVIVITVSLTIALGGVDAAYTWVWVLFYFTLIHSCLIMMGVFGLIKAMNAEHFTYPVIGRFFRT
jgi:uncharacterized Tic20 family protein